MTKIPLEHLTRTVPIRVNGWDGFVVVCCARGCSFSAVEGIEVTARSEGGAHEWDEDCKAQEARSDAT